MHKKTSRSPSKSRTSNHVRIIGGEWRSRVLNFPTALGLRPTGDRVRETLFNWLGQTLHGKHCLDVYAGSGALGFEAASRGAQSVIMIESNGAVCEALQQAHMLLAAQNCVIFQDDAVLRLQKLQNNRLKYDVVFVDPPFASALLEPTLAALPALLAPYARVYVEWASALPDSLVGETGVWQVEKAARAGVVHFALLSLK